MLVTAIATAGVAQAAWAWCGDPLFSLQGAGANTGTVSLRFAVDDGPWTYTPQVKIEAPSGVAVNVIDAQGSVVTTGNDAGLSVGNNAVQARITILVPGAGNSAGIKVSLSVDGRTLRQAVGQTDSQMVLTLWIPAK